LYKENHTKIRIICPRCKTEKNLNVPKAIVEKSEHLTTISIPAEFVCEHSFQVFIDKDFNIRAYQNADFEISQIEFYEDTSKVEETLITYALSLLINKTINILRELATLKEIMGGAVFNLEGKVLYSSLPDNVYLTISKAIENIELLFNENIKETIFTLKTDDKVFLGKIKVKDVELIVILLFSSKIKFDKIDNHIQDIYKKILTPEKPKERVIKKPVEKGPTPYWIYSKVSQFSSLKKGDSIYIDSIKTKVSKSVVVNLEEIQKISKNQPFEGKIYFTEKYVKLMEGLALTMKDASLFISKLNKNP
jgi:hypothetical protein